MDGIDAAQWSRRVPFFQGGGDILKGLKAVVGGELLSMSWAKLYDILSTCGVVKLDNPADKLDNPADSADHPRTFRALFLGEPPGSFVSAVNHYLATFHPGAKFEWLASGLEALRGGEDSAAAGGGFVAATRERWLLGDLRDRATMGRVIDARESVGGGVGFDLVTCDGAIDSSAQPTAQEALHAALKACELFVALSTLSANGSLVMSLFNALEPYTLGILAVLASSFKSVQVVKPVASKASNGEMFAVCVGFGGIPADVLAQLGECAPSVGPEAAIVRRRVIPTSFVNAVEDLNR
jgi:cap2 methyltransferase